MKNFVQPGTSFPVVVSDPAVPKSGDPVRFGDLTGVAAGDEGDGGNIATETTVHFGQGVFNLSVKGTGDAGDVAVAVGDRIYYVDADTPKLSKKSTGFFFGFALAAVASGATASIDVLKVPAAAAAANSLTGTVVANTADGNLVGGIPVLHRVDVPAGTTGDVDKILTHKTRVVDVHLVKTAAAGGGAGTIQVKNGAAAISDAMSINIADQTIARAATIDDANHQIAAGGTLRITRTRTASTDESCTVYVLGLRVA